MCQNPIKNLYLLAKFNSELPLLRELLAPVLRQVKRDVSSDVPYLDLINFVCLRIGSQPYFFREVFNTENFSFGANLNHFSNVSMLLDKHLY